MDREVLLNLRSESNPAKLEQKDHILRLARGARELRLDLEAFIEGLKRYVDDESAIDRPPLDGWWRLGGA